MGWSIGYDTNWNRDVGYGVPAVCDHPECSTEIDRGLSYVCGDRPYGGDNGCGLYFCGQHLAAVWDADGNEVLKGIDSEDLNQLCERCADYHRARIKDPTHPGPDTFKPKADHPAWVHHKLTDESWQQWRDENPEIVKALEGQSV